MRIPGIDPAKAEGSILAVLRAQTERWGAPLLTALTYARRPSIFRGTQAMWTGIAQSGLIDGKLQALINRRVAYLNKCAF